MLVEVDMFAAVAIFSTFAKLNIRHLLFARLSESFWTILEHPGTSWEALGTPWKLGSSLGSLLEPSWEPLGSLLEALGAPLDALQSHREDLGALERPFCAL